MLAPLLATEDPYAAASIFSQAGWKVEYESARDGDQPRACLSLAHSRIELVPPTDPYVVPRGLGVEFLIHVPPHELSGLFLLHRAAGVVFSEMRERRPGEGSGQGSSATASPSWVATLTRIWRWWPLIQGSWHSRMVFVSGTARIA